MTEGVPFSRRAIDFHRLASRLGEEKAGRRIMAQADLWARLTHQGEGVFVLERLLPMDRILDTLLKVVGLGQRGYRNYLDVRIIENTVEFPDLPEEFDGFRILQISDLHCDLDPALSEVVARRVQEVDHDLAVITGDFRNSTREDYAASMACSREIMRHLPRQALGILGNHDALEMVPYLEEAGLRILLNESTEVKRGSASLFVAGIDDPHFYRTQDLPGAISDVPGDAFKILLSHSPETYREADLLGFSFMLAGHTHGGQICLPGGIPLIRNGRCPVNMIAGPWSYGQLQGYTSRGTGSCGVAARFNCPPEITLHRLRLV